MQIKNSIHFYIKQYYYQQEGDFLLGDVAITWERQQAVEFSFFTLADSGAFVTQAPKSLNEALALVRPFHWNVWSLLIFTIAVTGPAFYFVIATPFWWQKIHTVSKISKRLHDRHYRIKRLQHYVFKQRANINSKHIIDLVYLKEMNYGVKNVAAWNKRYMSTLPKRYRQKSRPKNLLNKCFWFAITLFLRQCK